MYCIYIYVLKKLKLNVINFNFLIKSLLLTYNLVKVINLTV